IRSLDVIESADELERSPEMPTLSDLLVAFRQRIRQIEDQLSGKEKLRAITAEVDELRGHIEKALTLRDAYLWYLTTTFFDFSPEARHLIQGRPGRDEHWWDWLESHKEISAILRYLFGILLLILALKLAGVSIPLP